jgi:hypothetical protein
LLGEIEGSVSDPKLFEIVVSKDAAKNLKLKIPKEIRKREIKHVP